MGKRPTVPTSVVAWLTVIFLVFAAGGGIYILSTPNIQTIFTLQDGRWSMVYPNLSEQTINEGIVSGALYFLMFVGMFLTYRSTKVPYDTRKANTMLMLGVALLLMGLGGSYYLYNLKLTVFR